MQPRKAGYEHCLRPNIAFSSFAVENLAAALFHFPKLPESKFSSEFSIEKLRAAGHNSICQTLIVSADGKTGAGGTLIMSFKHIFYRLTLSCFQRIFWI
jgi:hypothetical protein